MLAKADDGLGLDLGEFGKGGIGPSDHMSFAMKKIPVLFFYDNMLIDYHRPTDTADKINFEGLNKVVELGQRVLTAMTTMPRQQYVSTYDATGLKAMGMGHGSRASLGVVPDYSEGTDGSGGVRISGTVPGSAAEKSGLKAGDVITHFADKKIDNLIDLTNALAAAKPGQKVKIEVKRDGKPVEIEATLTERK
jgi:membrane-associated protease RseP (regulator of RpoE activity)